MYRGRLRTACLDPTQTLRHWRRPRARSLAPHSRRRLRRCRRGRKLAAASSDSVRCPRRCTSSPCGRWFSLSTSRAHIHLSAACCKILHTHRHTIRTGYASPATTIISIPLIITTSAIKRRPVPRLPLVQSPNVKTLPSDVSITLNSPAPAAPL
jgi:hypothetical protein